MHNKHYQINYPRKMQGLH